MAQRSVNNPQVSAKLTGTLRNTLDDSVIASAGLTGASAQSLGNGAEANQCNRAWQYYQKTLSSGASLTIDLYDYASVDIGAGSGRDAVGRLLVMEEIVAILIKNDNASTADGQLEIEPGDTNGWTPIGSHTAANGGALRGHGMLLKFQPAEQGFDVADASSHTLKLTANGGDITYSIWLLGRSDDDVSSSSSSSSSSQSSSSSSASSSSTSSSSSSSQSSSSQSSSSSSSSVSTSSQSSSSQS